MFSTVWLAYKSRKKRRMAWKILTIFITVTILFLLFRLHFVKKQGVTSNGQDNKTKEQIPVKETAVLSIGDLSGHSKNDHHGSEEETHKTDQTRLEVSTGHKSLPLQSPGVSQSIPSQAKLELISDKEIHSFESITSDNIKEQSTKVEDDVNGDIHSSLKSDSEKLEKLENSASISESSELITHDHDTGSFNRPNKEESQMDLSTVKAGNTDSVPDKEEISESSDGRKKDVPVNVIIPTTPQDHSSITLIPDSIFSTWRNGPEVPENKKVHQGKQSDGNSVQKTEIETEAFDRAEEKNSSQEDNHELSESKKNSNTQIIQKNKQTQKESTIVWESEKQIARLEKLLKKVLHDEKYGRKTPGGVNSEMVRDLLQKLKSSKAEMDESSDQNIPRNISFTENTISIYNKPGSFYIEFKPLSPPINHSILLLHSSRDNSSVWLRTETLQTLARQGYRAIATDLPDFGHSYQVPIPPNRDARGRYLRDFMTSLNMVRPVLVSSSKSGHYAIPFIMQWPEMLSGFVAIAPTFTSQYRTSLYTNLKLKTLVLIGENDDTLADASAVDNLEHIPGRRIYRVRNASHLLYIDQPKTFNKLLITFLRELDKAK